MPGPKVYTIILVGKFDGYTQGEIREKISQLTGFTICKDFTESPDYLVYDKRSWYRKKQYQATQKAKEQKMRICEFGWLLDVFESNPKGRPTGPKRDQILWPPQSSVQSDQAGIVQRPKEFIFDQRMLEFYRRTNRGLRSRESTAEEESLFKEAHSHLDRLVEIHNRLSHAEGLVPAVRTKDLGSLAVDRERRDRHSIKRQRSCRSESTDPLHWPPDRTDEETTLVGRNFSRAR